MREVNLKESFPVAKRRVEKGWKTEENKRIAKEFGKEFFDGERVNGYGGYYYDGRWRGAVEKLQELYGINHRSSVLDIGCAKGFLLYDLQRMIPGIKVAGLDISKYALDNAMGGYANFLEKKGFNGNAQEQERFSREKVLPHMVLGSADNLPWSDNSFDVILSINTIHNLSEERCVKAIQEMNRVGKNPKHMYIEVDSFRTPEEEERMKWWVLTAKTVKSTNDWLDLYKKSGYEGDYSWMIA